jgi:[ribosomal protein S18]-alanine N-acetyltransferase
MEIRSAIFIDLPALTALAAGSTPAAQWSQAQFAQILQDEKARIFMAFEAGHPCGFVAGKFIAGEGEIENVVVAAAHRQRGIASALLLYFLREAHDRGIRRVLLEVRESNHAARQLYLKHGFKESGKRKKYYSNPEEDAVLLELKILERNAQQPMQPNDE